MSSPDGSLGEIAANLHSEGCSLEAQLSDDAVTLLSGKIGPEVSIESGKLIFSTLEERNKKAVSYHIEVLGESASPDDVFTLAHNLYLREYDVEDKLSGRLVATYAQGADLLLMAAEAISGKSSAEVFEVLHTLEAALPYCKQLTANGLIALCKAQFEATRHDLMSGHIFNMVRPRLEGDPATCEAILDTLRIQMSEDAGPIYGCATRALAATYKEVVISRLLQDSYSQNVELAVNAVWMLGVLASETVLPSELQPEIWQVFENQSQAVDAGIQRAAVLATEKALGVWPGAGDKLLSLAQDGDNTALLAMSQALLYRGDLLENLGLLDRFFASLVKTPGHLSGIVNNIDFVLDGLIKHGRSGIAVEFMESWIVETLSFSEADEFCEKLNSACNSIFNENKIFQRLLTRWLASPHHTLVRAAADMVSTLAVRQVDDLNLDLDTVLKLDTPSFLYMIRKIIGHILNEKSLVSLACSMVTEELVQRYGPNILKELFVDEIGMDYPGEVVARLKNIKENNSSHYVVEFCNSMIAEIEAYFESIKILPRLNDLCPPSRWERAFLKEQRKLIEHQKNKAEEKSIFRRLATVVPLKAGGASFSRFDGIYREPNKLSSISASYTLPRRHVLDPVGYEIHSLFLRIAKQGE